MDPKVRFTKGRRRASFLIVTRVDEISVEWLQEVVPTLAPWMGTVLRALVEDDIPKLVPAYRKKSDSLQISNRQLNTQFWIVWGQCPKGEGTTMDFLHGR